MDQLAERLKNLSPLQRAVLALKETQARLDTLERRHSEPIAIVGMACRFPGGVVDPQTFWQLLTAGVDAIRETPPGRWDVDRFFDPDPTVPGKMCSRWGGYLDHIDAFDNHFFGISDREAVRIDPQQRILLELAWEALEDAGLPPSSLRGTKAGVFIGISVSEYGIMLSSDVTQTDAHAAAGTSLCLAANRLSFNFGLQGPSMAIDTACSSSLVAVHTACQNIRLGECEMALAGGTYLLLSPLGTINLTKAGFCAKDGRVRAFDAAASGYVRSEGAGIVVLKPLSAALKSRDPIYAVIRGSAINQNGASNGLTAPSRAAQEQVLREAYARAKVSPRDIQYVETQGTGTRLGDTIEAMALGNALGQGRSKSSRCAIGSVKTNIGHTETASGMASLMKTALALKHGQLPPNLHFNTPNADIPFEHLPLRVVKKLEPWPETGPVATRLAGVSAFGFGGSNAHVVLEEAPANADDTSPEIEPGPYLLPLSARTENALRELAQRYVDFLTDSRDSLRDVCHTAALRRDHHDCRLAILAETVADARRLLQSFLDGQSVAGVLSGRKPFGRRLKIGFAYGDSAAGRQSDAERLVKTLPGFAAIVEDIDGAVERILGVRLLSARQSASNGHAPRSSAAVLVALQCALTNWCRSVGIAPDFVVGTYAGELAAAYAAGILTLDESLQLAASDEFQSGAAGALEPRPAQLPFVSSKDGQIHSGPDLGRHHWQACVDRSRNGSSQKWTSVVKAVSQQSLDFCLYVSADAITTELLSLNAIVPSLESLAALYAAGIDFNWKNLLPSAGRCVRLPAYPWQKQKHWVASGKWSAIASSRETAAGSPSPNALPRRARPDLIVPYAAPTSALEKSLAKAWSEVLGMDGLGRHDNFFQLGGDSLQATMLLNRLREDLGSMVAGHVLAGHVLFEVQTIGELAAYIERQQEQQPAAPAATEKAAAADGEGRTRPLSFAQQRLWLLDCLQPENPAYNIPMALRLSGPIDLAVLDRAMEEIVARHETLRTRIEMVGDQPRQVVSPPTTQIVSPPTTQKLPLVDLSDVDSDHREAKALEHARADTRRPFKLSTGPLFRAQLLRLAAEEHILVIVMHHIIADDWSLGVLFHELAALCRAFSQKRPSPLAKLPMQFGDYAALQRAQLQGESLDRLLNYWRDRLSGLATLQLPTDRPRPTQVSSAGATHRCLLPLELTQRIKELGRGEGATLFMTLLAAFQVLLHRYGGQDDFAIGSPIAGRASKETEGLIGLLANTLVLRADLGGDPTFRELLQRVRKTALEAFQYQEMPFEQLVEALNPPRDTSRHPLFQVLFTLQNAPWPNVQLDHITISHLPLDSPAAKFDLWLSMREVEAGLQTEIEFNVDLFDAATIERMMGHLETLLEAIVADADRPIGQLPLLSARQRDQIVVAWNDTAKDYRSTDCLHQLFEAQVARTPGAVAVDFEGRQLTYAELNRSANQIARYLARFQIHPDGIVGVCLERSLEMVTALLAILKAGGAYAPFDPDYPPQRLALMVADSRPAAILTTRHLAAQLPQSDVPLIYLEELADALATEDGDNLPVTNYLDDVAYVIYTSGSTGRPKGVRNTHRGIANRLLWMQDAYQLTGDDRVLQKTPYSFDVSVWEFFWPLITGARLVVAQPGGHKNPRYLTSIIKEQAITTLHFVPSMLAVFLEDDRVGECGSLKRVICSGEALSYELQQRFFARMSAELHNLYGPTEAAVDVTFHHCRPNDARIVPIGKPIANMQCYILDARLQPVPIGCAGELHLGGVGLARDYLNRPELTAERFIPHPFSRTPGARLYRTGDLCRWLPDGSIEYLGRLDFQVKIRGFRIELGEIEAALDSHPGIRQSVVVVDDRATGGPRLVAYCVPTSEQAISSEDLRNFLAARLPEYMVPAFFVSLTTMPLTPSGKVDRKALPLPAAGVAFGQAEYVAPGNDTERRLVTIWQELLHIERVGTHDNFFSLGGHSLLAAQVVTRIAREMHVELPLREMFQSPTISALAQCLDSTDRYRTMETPILPVPRDGEMLPSFTQEALWFLDQMERGRATYTIYSPLRISGPLNVVTVERALNEIVRRHEALRTRFPEVDGRPLAVIEPAQPRSLPLIDLSLLSLEQRITQLRQAIGDEMQRPIDLQNGPLMRVSMFRLADDEHVVLVSAHHMIYDGLSMGVLLRELTALYTAFEAGQPSPLAELPIQYADFAAWQRHNLQGAQIERLRDYWVKQLAGVPPLELPIDRARPTIRTTRGATQTFDLAADTSGALRDFCRREGVTPFVTLLAVFQVLLQRYSGQDDIAVGSPVANRARPETQDLIGYFVNVVVLRNDLSGDPSFRELLARVRRITLDAYDHQEMTLDQVVAAVNPPRDMSRHPLFQVMFALHNIELPQLTGAGLSMSPLEDGPTARASYFDLTLAFWQSGDTFRGEWNFSTDLFESDTIDRMAGHYETLLKAAISEPERSVSTLPVLNDEERQTVIDSWNQTAIDYPRDKRIDELFAAQAVQTPEAEAVVLGAERWSYRQLNDRANQLARQLQRRGVGPLARVGICMARSPQLLMAVLGVLKAGGTYVPLDPAFSGAAEERLKYIVANAQVQLVVTSADLTASLDSVQRELLIVDRESASEEPTGEVVSNATAGDIAYILYTSGSTGRPKGAMVTHRNVVNAYFGWKKSYQLETNVRTHLQMASFGFDVFGGDMVRALCSGGKLVICPKEKLLDPERLLQLIEREKVDMGEFVPVVMRQLLQYIEETATQVKSLKLAVVGSDAWYVAEHRRALRVLGPETRLINSYGLTETTIDSSFYEGDASRLPDGALVPIGRPMANVRLYVLDRHMQPVPVDVPGELYIGGDGVSLGYIDQDLDAGRFLDDPFTAHSDARLCKTGDRARWRADGNIEFLGRADHQIKIRGFRIEPGEIEEVLGEHPLLAQAAIAVHPRAADDLRLVAYVVGKTSIVPGAAELKQFLARRLPDYMIPAAFVTLDQLPTTSSGKVDRKVLPAPDWHNAVPRGDYVPPRSSTERQLAALWAELLQLQRVSIHDNFFDLGGTSLVALRLVSRVRSAFAVDLPLVTLFTSPSVAGLAQAIETLLPAGKAVTTQQRLLAPLRARGILRPLFCIHGLGGHIAAFLPLVERLDHDRPVYAAQAQGIDSDEEPHDRIETMAAAYLSEIRVLQPQGPYLLAGWSMGGLVALEAAKQLTDGGQKVALVAMFDSYLSVTDAPNLNVWQRDAGEQSLLHRIARQLNVPVDKVKNLPLDQQWNTIAELAERASGVGVVEIRRLAAVCKAHLHALAHYKPNTYSGPVVLFPAQSGRSDQDSRWKELYRELQIVPTPGDHFSLLSEPHVRVLAQTLDRYLKESDGIDERSTRP